LQVSAGNLSLTGGPYAPLASPIFTGVPKSVTAPPGDNSTNIATTAFVQTAAAFPSGTAMLFYQASAPVGWTQITTQNDKALRVVSGTGGGSGGATPFSTIHSQTVTGNHTLVQAEIPSVGGNAAVYPGGQGSGYNYPTAFNLTFSSIAIATGAPYLGIQTNASGVTYASSMSGPITTNGGGGAHSHPISMNIQYIDLIIASKN
jgi:hypothetical protein